MVEKQKFISFSYKEVQKTIQGGCGSFIDIKDLVPFYFQFHQPSTGLPSSKTHYGPGLPLLLQLPCSIFRQQDRRRDEGQVIWINLLVKYLLASSDPRCPTFGYISWPAFNQMTTSWSFSWLYCCPEKPGFCCQGRMNNG